MKVCGILLLAVLCVALAVGYAGAEQKTHIVKNQGAAGEKHVQGKKHSEHVAGKKSSRKSKHFNEKANHGEKLTELHKVEDVEGGGKKHKHNDEGHHAKKHEEEGGQHHAANFGAGEKHNKGNFEKGFNEKWHKNEFKKHDSFFSKGEHSGNYNIFGKKGAKHGSNFAAKAAGGTFKNLKTEGKHAKKSKKVGGHNKASKKGHRSSGGAKTQYDNNKKIGRKGGKKGGKQYKVKKGEQPPPSSKK